MQTPTIATPPTPDSPRAASSASSARPAAGAMGTTSSFRALASGALPDAVWVPVVAAILVLAAGAMSLATKRPWLFAALGPTALLVASSPGHPTARFHAVVLGHVSGFLCAWLAVVLMGAADAATALVASGPAVSRVWASAAAVAMMAAVQPTLRAYHPPAAATALLVTLGMHRLTWKTSLAMLGGVVVVALLGEWFQRVRLRERPARG